jgi:hypothetical protein
MKDIITFWAIRWVRKVMREDKSWRGAYTDNIAMTIYDTYRQYHPLTTAKGSPTVHEFSNICAERFMDLWLKD